jgi:phosphatidylserine/phosphatidylglycerophosphate/cardiolipin synthase-like enzyme
MGRRRIKRGIWIALFLLALSSGLMLYLLGDVESSRLSEGTAKLATKHESVPAVESPAAVVPKYIIPTYIIPAESTSSSIEVYFCPHDDCEGRLFSLLSSAESSIHCATFELNLPRIVSLLENKSRDGVEVGVVVDGNYYDEVENFSWARHDGSQGLMHNKFCVVDGKMVYGGSMNPTKNCAYKNNNNMVVIESKYLAENYEAEFDEVWAGEFGEGEKVPYPKILWNNISIQNYFCPEDGCRQHIRDELAKANSSIYFLQFSFTEDNIGRDLVMKHAEGIDVRGVFEKTKISNYSEYHLLQYQGIDVRLDKNKYNMHHKVWIIDNRIVITGSYNPSNNAEYDNDENVLIIEDERVAGMFLEEFRQVWEEAGAIETDKS